MGNGSRPGGGHGVPVSRLVFMGVAMGVVFVIYLGYLFSMQVVDGYIYRLRADQVTRRTAVVHAPRGDIYDRSVDRPIAASRDSFAVDINPAVIPSDEIDAVFVRVAAMVGVPVTQIYDRIPRRRYSVYQPVEIAGNLTLQTITRLAEHSPELPGVSWRIRPVRSYPDDGLFAHVLGYVGEITPAELQVLFNRGYTATSVIGKAGVELQYDEVLRGIDGNEYRFVDARGRRIGASTTNVEPVKGNDLVLTVDRRIQDLATKALGNRVGAAVVLHPATGEILAMVSHPGYNANRFFGPGGAEYFSEISLDPRGSFLNRTLQATESPGSTFKVLMTTAILEERAFPADRTVYCPGYYMVGNRVFACHKEYGHGHVDLATALAESCNVYYYTVGNEYLGVESIIDYSQIMGLGERSGIDLPRERAGLVPTPEWKERTFSDGWRPGDTVNLSIGQGFLQVTPLQLANMVGMIVNRGVIYRPHVVKEIRDPATGATIESFASEALRTAPISEQTFAQVQQMLRGVVLDGTPAIVMTSNAEAGGKTGTAETWSDEHRHSWYIGFAPYGPEKPADYVVTAVWVDASNEWDWWGPYATNIIVHGIYNGLTYEETIMDLRRLRDPWLWYGRGILGQP
ncbi:MAG: penicillin-binding protein 2 [Spirochaetaceae bacterium]|nr:MAG: penicillin-binding protein 2 [Spirochaetaceae bacterium]